MEDVRLEWLREDLGKLFPYFKPLYDSDTGRYETLYLSRFGFPDGWLDDTMSTERRVELLKKKGRKTAIVDIPDDSKIIRMMAELSHGIPNFSDWEDAKKAAKKAAAI
jgi:hypothetical protein